MLSFHGVYLATDNTNLHELNHTGDSFNQPAVCMIQFGIEKIPQWYAVQVSSDKSELE